jgi:hypothetical protein
MYIKLSKPWPLPQTGNGAKNFMPVNAAAHAEERCERDGTTYNAEYERAMREMANDCLAGV